MSRSCLAKSKERLPPESAICYDNSMLEHSKEKTRFFPRYSFRRPRPTGRPQSFGQVRPFAEIKPPAKREITAGLIVFRKTPEGPKYLLLYHRGSYWNFPKGHVEKEEGSLDAAIRETTEETGLRRSDLRILPNFKTSERFFFRKEKETIFKIVIIFLAETREKNVKISDEHQGYGWFLLNDAKKILGKYRENRKTLIQADDFLHFKGKSRAAGTARPTGRPQSFGHARLPDRQARRFTSRPPFPKK